MNHQDTKNTENTERIPLEFLGALGALGVLVVEKGVQRAVRSTEFAVRRMLPVALPRPLRYDTEIMDG
jgi:hypothetical protein